jgi:hypothetical protein
MQRMLNITPRERQRRDEQRRHSLENPEPKPDLIIGARNIAHETGQKLSSVYYWFSKGMYGDAVWKAGHKTLAASRQRLLELGKAKS